MGAQPSWIGVAGGVGAADAGGMMALASVRRSPIHWLILSGMLLIAAIVVGTAVTVGNFRERALSSSERELENTVLLLARHFDQQLGDAEVIQNSLVEYIYAAGIDTPEDYRRRIFTQLNSSEALDGLRELPLLANQGRRWQMQEEQQNQARLPRTW